MRALLRSTVGTGRFLSRGRYISSADATRAASEDEPTLPNQARAVIIGGGVIGASCAYNLTKLGWDDGKHSNPPEIPLPGGLPSSTYISTSSIAPHSLARSTSHSLHTLVPPVVLLESNTYTSGTTWHAAGLVGLTRGTSAETALSLGGAALYDQLEEDTGLNPGFKRCGSVNVARTADRMESFKRQLVRAKACGIEGHIISPKECGEYYAGLDGVDLLRTDDLVGGVWWPADGSGSPTDLTNAMLRGAKQRGARLFDRTAVDKFLTSRNAATGVEYITGVETTKGTITADVVVLCAGQWSRQIAAQHNVSVPLHSAEHYYIITQPIEGVHHELPVMRDPDGREVETNE